MDYLKRLTHCTFTCKDYPAMVRFLQPLCIEEQPAEMWWA